MPVDCEFVFRALDFLRPDTATSMAAVAVATIIVVGCPCHRMERVLDESLSARCKCRGLCITSTGVQSTRAATGWL